MIFEYQFSNIILMKKISFLLVVLIQTFCLQSQTITQTIKGQVFDSNTRQGLPGASIVIAGSDPIIGVTTNAEGYFTLDNIPVGRVSIKVSFLGYEPILISDLLITSGKEIVLSIPMNESFTDLDEITISPESGKDKPINSMATLSAKTFSVEQAGRYAGGMDDPSRLAASFAGVAPSTVENNEIVIRGNPAKGILWRVEGVEIPAPNHLAGLFSGGGVNTMFNSSILSNSDFFTGAFPAEYGNAISGVFDINLRIGNNAKKEYSFQAGTYGIDMTAEGPFSSSSVSSYLINYRYSTYGLLQQLLPHVTGLPAYSDLALKLNIPTSNAGIFSMWSINGTGNVESNNSLDTTEWVLNYDSYDYNITYRLSASGINHKTAAGPNTYITTSFSMSATEYINHNMYFRPNLTVVPVSDQNETEIKYSLQSNINHRFSRRININSGFMVSSLQYKYKVEANTDVAHNDKADFSIKHRGKTFTGQYYIQSGIKLSSRIEVKPGFHLLYNSVNDDISLEPRIGISARIADMHKISVAYGNHGKTEPLRIYLMDVETDDGLSQPNKKLKTTKAHHYILSYDWKISEKMLLRLEPYYQKLYNVPVIPDSSFSMINYNNEIFFISELNNEGSGTNLGIDLTLERFLKDGLYYMLTASLFDSRYKGGDGIERKTRYDQNYVINLLGGKEWYTSTHNTLSLNGKFTVLGGRRYSPVDIPSSLESRYVVYDETRVFEKQAPTNYYLDISVNYTINKPKASHSLVLHAKNMFLEKEFLGHAYNFRKNQVEPYELAIVFPYLSYTISF